MSLIRWDNAPLALVYLGAILVCVLSLWFTFGHAQAASLSIIGSSIGQGVHSLNFSGAINASILQGMNNSSWQILAEA